MKQEAQLTKIKISVLAVNTYVCPSQSNLSIKDTVLLIPFPPPFPAPYVRYTVS